MNKCRIIRGLFREDMVKTGDQCVCVCMWVDVKCYFSVVWIFYCVAFVCNTDLVCVSLVSECEKIKGVEYFGFKILRFFHFPWFSLLLLLLSTTSTSVRWWWLYGHSVKGQVKLKYNIFVSYFSLFVLLVYLYFYKCVCICVWIGCISI